MKRSWWHVVKHVLFGLHSPSLLAVGRCWCQRNGVEMEPMTQEELDEAMRIAVARAFGGWE